MYIHRYMSVILFCVWFWFFWSLLPTWSNNLSGVCHPRNQERRKETEKEIGFEGKIHCDRCPCPPPSVHCGCMPFVISDYQGEVICVPWQGPWQMSQGVDWCCFYYFLRNSLVALLEALFARIFLDLRYRCAGRYNVTHRQRWQGIWSWISERRTFIKATCGVVIWHIPGSKQHSHSEVDDWAVWIFIKGAAKAVPHFAPGKNKCCIYRDMRAVFDDYHGL